MPSSRPVALWDPERLGEVAHLDHDRLLERAGARRGARAQQAVIVEAKCGTLQGVLYVQLGHGVLIVVARRRS